MRSLTEQVELRISSIWRHQRNPPAYSADTLQIDSACLHHVPELNFFSRVLRRELTPDTLLYQWYPSPNTVCSESKLDLDRVRSQEALVKDQRHSSEAAQKQRDQTQHAWMYGAPKLSCTECSRQIKINMHMQDLNPWEEESLWHTTSIDVETKLCRLASWKVLVLFLSPREGLRKGGVWVSYTIKTTDTSYIEGPFSLGLINNTKEIKF